ncbi:MAG: RimK/LysX family protein [Proteobacteria bacterium]|nr:RimK/LysX family protein [Pseudomonadota bacterium]
MKRSSENRPLIGWREWIALPDLKIARIKVKVDTGARTSALHAFNIRPFCRSRRDWVEFEVHPLQQNNTRIRKCACPALDYRWVKNSGGGREKRYVIETVAQFDGQEWPIEVTLTDRDQMGFRMLLGRSAMQHRFIVDPGASYVLQKPLRRAKSKHKQPRER